MIIAISGVPGTGKTTLAKQLAKTSGYTYVDVKKIIMDEELYAAYNKKADTYDVDVEILDEWLSDNLDLQDNLIIDSHLSHELSFVDKIVVCNCELGVLKARLEARGYSESKIRDNLDSEIFDYCYSEAVELGKKATKVDCSTEVDIQALSKTLGL